MTASPPLKRCGRKKKSSGWTPAHFAALGVGALVVFILGDQLVSLVYTSPDSTSLPIQVTTIQPATEQRHVDGYNLAAELLGEDAIGYLESAPCYKFTWNGSWQNSPEAHEAYIKAEAYSNEIEAELTETYESYLDLMILHQWPVGNPVPLNATEYPPIGTMPERATNE